MSDKLFNIYNDELRTLNFKIYNSVILNEIELLEIVNIIKANNDVAGFVKRLLKFCYSEENYTQILDWNVGSTIQHFNSKYVIDAFKSIDSELIYNSIGLTWVLGEFKIKDEKVIEFLYDCVRKSTNSEVWWRAAFSLELLGQEKAINFLKRSLKQNNLESLDHYLNNIQSKKSVIGILLLSSNSNVKKHIFPKLKNFFNESLDTKILINSIWLLGRLKLIDKDIKKRVKHIIKTKKDNSELIYYLFFAIKDSSSIEFHDIFKGLINSSDLLIRKMSIRGLSNIKHSDNKKILEAALLEEDNPSVLEEITKGLYSNINTQKKEELYLKKNYSDVENGLIGDSSDKWYSAPHIYEIFSFSEDPENLCLDLIFRRIKKHKKQFENPIDLATGTGRGIRYFIDKLNYSGNFYGVDKNDKMLEFLRSTLNRKRGHLNNFKLINTSVSVP
jgi:hypothetical protein